MCTGGGSLLTQSDGIDDAHAAERHEPDFSVCGLCDNRAIAARSEWLLTPSELSKTVAWIVCVGLAPRRPTQTGEYAPGHRPVQPDRMSVILLIQ